MQGKAPHDCGAFFMTGTLSSLSGVSDKTVQGAALYRRLDTQWLLNCAEGECSVLCLASMLHRPLQAARGMRLLEVLRNVGA
jgi:hypothetical protein